jgi:hypothetical protein
MQDRVAPADAAARRTACPNNLGQLVRLADGRIVVDVIGLNGTNAVNGNIFIYDGQFPAVPNLNQKRQRQGLALTRQARRHGERAPDAGPLHPRCGLRRRHQRLFAAEPDAKFPDAGVVALLHILPVN